MNPLEWVLSRLTGISPPDPALKQEKKDCLQEIHDGVVDGSLDAATVCLGLDQVMESKGTKHLKEGVK